MLAKAAPLLVLVSLAAPLMAQDDQNPLVNVPTQATPPPAQILEFFQEGNHEALSKIAGGLEECLAVFHPDVRMFLVNLDDDEDSEAIVACIGIGDAKAIVLDQHETKWLMVARLSAWLNYEREPLGVFVQTRGLGEGRGADLLVRNTIGHGSGVYERQLVVYTLRGTALQEILRLPDELSDWCGWDPGVCHMRRQKISQVETMAKGKAKTAIVVRTYEGKLPIQMAHDPSIDSDRFNPRWWEHLQVVKCEGFLWNEKEFRFAQDSQVTSEHCEEIKPADKK